MNDGTGFLAAVLKELATSTAVILAAWGALGGATNALTTRMRLRDALRHILLGGLIAAGMGSLSMALVTSSLGLPPRRSSSWYSKPPPVPRPMIGGTLKANTLASGNARNSPRSRARIECTSSPGAPRSAKGFSRTMK